MRVANRHPHFFYPVKRSLEFNLQSEIRFEILDKFEIGNLKFEKIEPEV